MSRILAGCFPVGSLPQCATVFKCIKTSKFWLCFSEPCISPSSASFMFYLTTAWFIESSLLHSLQTGCRVHAASYPLGYFPRVKVVKKPSGYTSSFLLNFTALNLTLKIVSWFYYVNSLSCLFTWIQLEYIRHLNVAVDLVRPALLSGTKKLKRIVCWFFLK